jgi:hypothetical protein
MDQAAVDQALVESGYTGPDALLEFQAAHVGPDGRHLVADGIVGPNTAWALQHPGAALVAQGYTVSGWRRGDDQWPQAVREVLAVAIAEIGTAEYPDGTNRGPRVDVYTTPDLGEPWCAFFASWAWSRRDSGSPFGRIGSVYGLRDWGHAHGRLVDGAPQPGDIFLILRSGDDPEPGAPRRGHCGLVCAVLEDAMVATCEGNASNAVRGLVRPVELVHTSGQTAHYLRPLGS